VNSIVFNSGASPFTITVPVPNYLALIISGAGITNNSGTTQNFVAAGDLSTGYYGLIQFLNNATAGSSTSFTINTAEMYFYNTSSAGSGSFTINGTALSGATGAAVLIVGNADSATLIANAGSNGGSSPITNVSKNHVVWPRCHFAGLASGIDCAP